MSNKDNIKDEILTVIKNSFTRKQNIFASITLSDEEKTNKNDSVCLSPIFANKKLDFDNLLSNVKQTGIEDEIENDLSLLDGLSGIAWENTLMSIYEKYTSFCPCSEAGFEDIPYYQKKKFETAIEKAGGEDNLAYLMVEVTGIFEYIFNFRQNDEGTLKRMRARSYICLLISRAIILYLLNELRLPKCNVLDDGGELFGILFNKNGVQTVRDCIKQIKEELIIKFDGRINLLYVIKDGVDKNALMENSVSFMEELSEGLYENEFHQFDDIPYMLSKDTFRVKSPQTCDYCGRDFEPKDSHNDKECSLCHNEFDIGKDIPKAEYIISYMSDDKALLNITNISFLSKIGFIFCRNKKEVKDKIEGIMNASYIDIASVNSTNFINKINDNNVSYSFITIGNAAPLIDGKIMDFDQMKKNATGAQYLSALKMDADNFGKVTTKGFGSSTSLLRIATISAYFKYFFQGYLTNRIIEEKNAKRDYKYFGYTVYSGGDDLFLIAPWDKIIDLSLSINDEFQKFTGNNEFLSLTGGIATFTGTIPIKRIGKLAGDEESKAKKYEHRDKTKKNGIAVFGKLYKWTNLSELKDFMTKEVISITSKDYHGPFSNNLIYDLHRLTSAIDNDKKDLTAIPNIFFRLRNSPELLKKSLPLYDYLIGSGQYKFHFIANYCSLITRKEER